MAQAPTLPKHPYGEIVVPAPRALVSGECFELPDGRAATYQGLKSAELGEDVAGQYAGIIKARMASATVMAVDANLYWNYVNKVFATADTPGETILVGKLVLAKVAGDDFAICELNKA